MPLNGEINLEQTFCKLKEIATTTLATATTVTTTATTTFKLNDDKCP